MNPFAEANPLEHERTIAVLYADDGPALLEIGRKLLEKRGDMKVTTVLSGEEMLGRLGERQFDAIISDFHTKGMDGIVLLKEIRQRYPDTQIIFFTAKGCGETVVREISPGTDPCPQGMGDIEARFDEIGHMIREAVRQRITRYETSRADYAELVKNKRSLEELETAYEKLNATYSALRDNFRILMEREAAVRQSEEKYRNLFVGETNAIFLIDTDSGMILEANNPASELYGFSREDFLAKQEHDLLAEPATGGMEADPLMSSDPRITPLLQYHKKNNGATFPVEVTKHHFVWRGRPVCFATIRDITLCRQAADDQRERIERKVSHQKSLVQLATADAPTLRIALNRITETGATVLQADRVGIWFFSPDGGELLCNNIYIRKSQSHINDEAQSGSDHARYFAVLQELRTIAVTDVWNDNLTGEFYKSYLEPRGVQSKLDIPIRSGKTVIGVLSFEQTVSLRNWEMEDQDFAIALADYAAIILEQARRRLAEKDFRRSERKYRAVVDRANDGIVIVQDGFFRFVNPKAAEILGSSSEEIAGTPFIARVAPAEKDRIIEQNRRKAGGAETPRIIDTVLLRKDGTPVSVELNSGNMEFDGKPSDLIFIRDITDRIRSEQALLLANQKLNLLSSVTRHDILNKLTIVIGYLEMAKMTHDREKLEDFIKKMDDTLQIVENQVQFTRDYQDLGLKEPEWQNMETTLDAAISQLDTGMIRIQNRLGGLSLYADPLLEKVLYNIIDNAIRYGESLTEIMASYTVGEGSAVLVIEDNGIGIPVKNKTRIFEKGFGHHTGLGLFLAREILSLTGIEIMETGFPTKGARFEIYIPAGRFRIRE